MRYVVVQVDEYERGRDGASMEEEPVADYLKTDLKDAIQCFEQTFMQPLWASIRCGPTISYYHMKSWC
jgi:hypothetical protein